MRASIPNRLILPLLSSCVAISALWSVLPPAFAQAFPEAIHNYNQGIDAYSQGHTQDALKKFERATQIDPAYGDAYYNMGSIYYQMKQYNDAANLFQKAVNLSPNDGQAKYNLALSLEKLNRSEEAINILMQIPPGDPKSGQAKAKLDELRPSLKPQLASGTPATTKPAAVEKPKPAATVAPATTKPVAASAGKPAAPQVFSKGYDGPTGITIGPGGFMYVANYSKNLIYRVGANGEKNIFAQGEGLKGPIGLTFNPKSNELYVANYLLGSVIKVNATGKVSVLMSGLNKPYNLFLDTVNNALYVSEQDPANVISRINLPK